MTSYPRYVQIEPNSEAPEISALAPFKAIVVLESEYETAWQASISEWLVKSGCRYMMAWGPNCSSWDDSVDHADIDAGGLEDDAKFVMTTWHEDETLESVFWYSQFCANFSYDEVELENVLIVHVSNVNREAEYLDLFEKSETLAEREPD